MYRSNQTYSIATIAYQQKNAWVKRGKKKGDAALILTYLGVLAHATSRTFLSALSSFEKNSKTKQADNSQTNATKNETPPTIAKRIQHDTIVLLKVGHIGLQALMISASYNQLKRDIELNRYIHTLTFKDANYMVSQRISIATLAFAICHSAQSSWKSFKKAFEKTVVTSSPITSP